VSLYPLASIRERAALRIAVGIYRVGVFVGVTVGVGVDVVGVDVVVDVFVGVDALMIEGKKNLHIDIGTDVGVRVGVCVSENVGVGVGVGGATPNFWMRWLLASAT